MSAMSDQSHHSDAASAPLGVIAGQGRLPYEVLCALRAKGRPAVVIALKGEADPSLLQDFHPEFYSFGQIGSMLRTLKAANCTSLVLIGGVGRRPDFSSLVGDLETLKRLPKILKAVVGGDDGVLRGVISLIEGEGFSVVGVQDVAPELLVGDGVLTERAPGPQDLADMAKAAEAASVLGSLDIGQAVVAVNGRLVAVEGAEGTDALLQRVAEMRAAKRFSAKGAAGVLVKRAKPHQELRVDLPTIGPETVRLAKAAGLRGLALESGTCLIAERRCVLEEAQANGLFLVGQTFEPYGSSANASPPNASGPNASPPQASGPNASPPKASGPNVSSQDGSYQDGFGPHRARPLSEQS